ncbi:hypothetical protein COV82_04965 [Candidatus Peregrinibacteria bacterium CG11_big_fil_rev_8_21_14_0_20_46_8]|nr:MAG: hypothetical protein COV82_04965 [Candidatus Peregrinibacteria bacterium CG11_big_fil_rev_8_21_14_0_20_46_8]
MGLTQTQQDIVALLQKSKDILILPSSPIDGDCLGSSLSLYLVLKKLGKNVTVVAEEKIPHSYDFLPSIKAISETLDASQEFVISIDCRDHKVKNVRHEIQGNKVNIFVTPESGTIDKDHVSFENGAFKYDCIITVDAADPSQFGSIYENFPELLHLAPVINIDHHASNSSFGKINLVDIMAPSTTVLLLPIIEALGEKLMDEDVATLLLAGLITDTGSFQNPNTTPDAFAIAAKLIGFGARQQEIIRHIYKTKQLSQLRLWGRTLTKIQHDMKYKMVWSVLTKKDFDEIGASPDQTEGVIDELMSNAPNAEIIFLLKDKDGEVKSSIRTTTSSIDASELATMFDGGGHAQAAGFPMKGINIEEAEKQVLEKFRAFQSKRLHLGDHVEEIKEAGKQDTGREKQENVMQEIEPPQSGTPQQEVSSEPARIWWEADPKAPPSPVPASVSPASAPVVPAAVPATPEPAAPEPATPEPTPAQTPHPPAPPAPAPSPAPAPPPSPFPPPGPIEPTPNPTEPKPPPPPPPVV